MSCNNDLELLAAWLLDDEHRFEDAALDGHIHECPYCQSKIAHLKRSGRFMESTLSKAPPTDLFEKIDTRISRISPASKKKGVLRKAFAYALVTSLVAIFVIFQMKSQPQQTMLPDPDFETFASNHQSLPSVSASPALTQSDVRNFESHNQLIVHKPTNMPGGWRLVKLDHFTCRRGRTVAQLVYSRGSGVVSIFQKPIGGGPGKGMGRGRGMGMGMGNGSGMGPGAGMGMGPGRMMSQGQCRWSNIDIAFASNDRHRFVVMGDLPMVTLQSIADNLSSQK